MLNNEEISKTLIKLSPAIRVKHIRQKILKQNQQTFCEDGIIRSGTLKSIETQRMKIGPKIAERLAHKLSLEGIICEPNIFLDQENPCEIKIDMFKKDLTGNSMNYLEKIRQKLTQLTPIEILNDAYFPQIPAGSTLLAREATKENLKYFQSTLCFIKGNKSSLYYLTYINEQELEGELNNKKITLSSNIIDFCSVFIVEIIYLGDRSVL